MAGYEGKFTNKPFLGWHASDAAALSYLQSLHFDTNDDGTGTPRIGLCYINTTDNQKRTYYNGAWRANFMADGSVAASGDFNMNTNKITGLGAATASTDAVSKGYVDGLVTGPAAVHVINLIDDSLNDAPGGESEGDSYIVGSSPTGDWVSFSTGDLISYVGASWVLILAGTGSTPADGTRAVICGIGSGTGAGSFTGYDDYVAKYTTGTGWSFTAPSDGWFLIVKGEGAAYENSSFVYDASSTSWIEFAGATANHNDLSGLQGGTTGEYYHLTSAQHAALTGGNNADSYHYHAQYGKVWTGAGLNPNGVVTPEAAGDVYVQNTTPYLKWMAHGATNTSWSII